MLSEMQPMHVKIIAKHQKTLLIVVGQAMPLSFTVTHVLFGNSKDLLRRIMVTEDLRADRNYFLRVRQILDDSNAEFQFDYIEIVPKSVYAGNEPEDRH